LPSWRLSIEKFVANYVVSLEGIDLNDVSVLDLGCGYGYMLLRLSGLLCKARLVGVDINSSAISQALANAKQFQGKANVEFRCTNAENLTCRDGKFDVAVANLSFSAFRRPARVASVVSHLLKPNGRLIASEVSSTRPLGKLGQLADAASRRTRYNLFSPTGLTNLFIPYGFRRIRIARVPLKARLMKSYLSIPSGLSPVFLVELSKPISYTKA
jgi:ubiquinone/menaquinone biosynthesis C-methylase UbiE